MIILLLFGGQAQLLGQRAYLSDYANEQLETVPQEHQDSFFLVQGRYYYAFYTRESYRRAMECYLEALRLGIQYGHQDVVTDCYSGIASVYDANNNLKQAARYYKMYYDRVLKRRPFTPTEVLRATYNIAATYAKAKDTATAYHYTLKMSQMIGWVKEDTARARYLLLIAHTFENIGKSQDFLDYFEKIPRDMRFRDGELAFGRLYAESKSRYAYLKGKRAGITAPLLEELAHTRDSIPLLNLLVDAYAALGDYQKAYETQELLINADMRSMDRNTYGDINYRLLEADNLLKQRDNSELQLNGQKLRFRTSILYTLSTLLAAGLALTLLLYRRYRLRHKFVHAHNRQLEAYDAANKRMVREVHGSTGSNLQQIGLLIPAGGETGREWALSATRSRLQAASLAHQLAAASEEAATTDMQAYFETLTAGLPGIFGLPEEVLSCSIQMNGNRLCAVKLASLGLAVNEMLISSISAYETGSGPVHIAMECRFREGELHFTYRDLSLPPASEGNVTVLQTTGTRLLQQLCRPLNAKIQADRKESGTEYLFIFSK